MESQCGHRNKIPVVGPYCPFWEFWQHINSDSALVLLEPNLNELALLFQINVTPRPVHLKYILKSIFFHKILAIIFINLLFSSFEDVVFSICCMFDSLAKRKKHNFVKSAKFHCLRHAAPNYLILVRKPTTRI